MTDNGVGAMRLSIEALLKAEQEIRRVTFGNMRGAATLQNAGILKGPNGKYYQLLPSDKQVRDVLAEAMGERHRYVHMVSPLSTPKHLAEQEAVKRGWVHKDGTPTDLGRCIYELHKHWSDVRKIDRQVRDRKRTADQMMLRFRYGAFY